MASEHSAGGVGFGRSAEHGGLRTAALGADTDHATTGVEAPRPARHQAGPAQRAEETDHAANGDGSEAMRSDAQPHGDVTTAVAETGEELTHSGDAAQPIEGPLQQPAGSAGDVISPVAGAAGSSGAGSVSAQDADSAAPIGGALQQPAGSAGTGNVPTGDTAPVADAAPVEVADAAPIADGAPVVGATQVADAAPVADGAAPVEGADVAPVDGSVGGGSAPVEDVVAPVAGVVRQLGAPAGGGAVAPAAPGAGLAEAAAPIVGVVEQVGAPLRDAAESLPKPGESLLPGAGGLLPGLGTQPDDDSPQVPVAPGNGGGAGQSGGSVTGFAAVAPFAPGMNVLPAEELTVVELAAERTGGSAQQPVDDMPSQPQPRRGELPATVNVGSVPNTSNGGAGNGPAAQDAEQVGAASERMLLGVARTSDGHALSNDADKPPVSPD